MVQLKTLQSIKDITALQHSLNPARPVIAVCASRKEIANLDFMHDLYVRIRQAGYQTLFLLGAEVRVEDFAWLTEPLQGWCVAYPGLGKHMPFINLVFMVDRTSIMFPPSSRVLVVRHGNYLLVKGSDDIHNGDYERYLTRFDGEITPYPIDPAPEVLTQWMPRDMVRHPDRPFVFIPAGHLKLDRLIRHCAATGQRDDAVIFAPTFAEYRGATAYYEPIIGLLMEFTEQHAVIFRPAPGDLDLVEVKRLCDKWAGHKRFVLDMGSSYADSYARCALMVTDFSYTAATFSLMTLRPHIRCDLAAEGRKAGRHEYGHQVYSLAQLADSVRQLLDGPQTMRTQLQQQRDRKLCNPGHCADYLVECLPDLLAGRCRDTWAQVKKTALPAERSSTTEDTLRLLKHMEYRDPPTRLAYLNPKKQAALFAREHFPSDRKGMLEYALALAERGDRISPHEHKSLLETLFDLRNTLNQQENTGFLCVQDQRHPLPGNPFAAASTLRVLDKVSLVYDPLQCYFRVLRVCMEVDHWQGMDIQLSLEKEDGTVFWQAPVDLIPGKGRWQGEIELPEAVCQCRFILTITPAEPRSAQPPLFRLHPLKQKIPHAAP